MSVAVTFGVLWLGATLLFAVILEAILDEFGGE